MLAPTCTTSLQRMRKRFRPGKAKQQSRAARFGTNVYSTWKAYMKEHLPFIPFIRGDSFGIASTPDVSLAILTEDPWHPGDNESVFLGLGQGKAYITIPDLKRPCGLPKRAHR